MNKFNKLIILVNVTIYTGSNSDFSIAVDAVVTYMYCKIPEAYAYGAKIKSDFDMAKFLVPIGSGRAGQI